MNINGIGPQNRWPVAPRVADGTRSSPEAAPQSEVAKVEAPAGHDASLWSVLTEAERAFFLDQAALGPVTYGPSRGVAPSTAPLGQRIDVRA